MPVMLQTLQRRIGEWRGSMARTLVLTGATRHLEVSPISPSTGTTLGDRYAHLRYNSPSVREEVDPVKSGKKRLLSEHLFFGNIFS